MTAVDRATLDEVTRALELLTHRLTLRPTTMATPDCSCCRSTRCGPRRTCRLTRSSGTAARPRPDVEVRIADGEVVGTRDVHAPLRRSRRARARWDQRDARRPIGGGVADGDRQRTVTKSLTLRYLRALPLDEEVELWGGCTPTASSSRRSSRCAPAARSRWPAPRCSCPTRTSPSAPASPARARSRASPMQPVVGG